MYALMNASIKSSTRNDAVQLDRIAFVGRDLVRPECVLATATGRSLDHWPVWLLAALTTLVVWRTQLPLLWLLGAGAVLGALGWV